MTKPCYLDMIVLRNTSLKFNSMFTIDKISQELKKLSQNPKNIKDYSKFHKDGKKHIGIATPLVRKLSAEYFKEIKNLEKKQIFLLCEKLLKIGGSSYQDIAFDWAFRIKKQYTKEDFKIFESWLKKYVNEKMVVDLLLNSSTLGGIQLSYKGKYIDLSLRKKIVGEMETVKLISTNMYQ